MNDDSVTTYRGHSGRLLSCTNSAALAKPHTQLTGSPSPNDALVPSVTQPTGRRTPMRQRRSQTANCRLSPPDTFPAIEHGACYSAYREQPTTSPSRKPNGQNAPLTHRLNAASAHTAGSYDCRFRGPRAKSADIRTYWLASVTAHAYPTRHIHLPPVAWRASEGWP